MEKLAPMVLALLAPAMSAGDAVPRWDAALPDATKPAAGLPLLTNKSACSLRLPLRQPPAPPPL
eukprot:COSAG04_NODE_6906_length_1231_cov_1.161661_1_plen_64_part_00